MLTAPFPNAWCRASRSALGLLLLLAFPVMSQPASSDQCQDWVNSDDIPFDFSHRQWELNPANLPADAAIGDIVVRRLAIFDTEDPQEDNWLFRGANRLHITTRESTIRAILLFTEGSVYDAELLEQSARALRNTEYLYDAKIFPFRHCGQRVDVMVVTKDVWTLTPGISLTRAGGTNTSSLVLRDSNLVGLGKRLALEQKKSVDREGVGVEYQDPNLFGSRLSLELRYSDSDDGNRQQLVVARPFYSLDTQWALALVVDENNRVESRYQRGQSVAAFRTLQKNYDISYGFLVSQEHSITRRNRLGFSWRELKFSPEPDQILPTPFPANRQTSHLWLGYQLVEDNFISLSNLNQIYQTEDINLGRSWFAKIGWSDRRWGGDSDRLAYAFNASNAWQPSPKQLLTAKLALEGFWDQDNNHSDDLSVSNQLRYYQTSPNLTGVYAALDLNYVRNLPAHQQLLLGGEQGLRGYPLRYQDGDRSFLLTLEQRFYSAQHWYRLFRTGAVIFVDIGRAWFPGDPTSGATGMLGDFGIGLRLASSRTEKRTVLHLDIALPIQAEEDIDKVQFLVTGKQQF